MVRTRLRARGHVVRACAMAAWLVATVVFAAPVGAQQAATYYVDARYGSDANPGTSPISPWRSLAKASGVPSDSHLYLHADQTFAGTLIVSASRVEVSAYGVGHRPIIERSRYAGIEIRGDDVVVRGLVLRDNVAGIWTRAGAERSVVDHNLLVDNNRMSVNTRGGRDDSGAFGVLIHGDHGDFHQNVIVGSDAFSYDYGRDGSAFEVYGGSHNRVYRNTARDNQTFVELGKASSDPESVDNQFAYNRVTGTEVKTLGVVTRGPGAKGPVLGTRLRNNTIDLSGRGSEGFVCSACSSRVLVMENNIVRAAGRVGFVRGSFGGDRNLYWGAPMRFRPRPHDLVANPRFVSAGDLHLRRTSPARNSGAPTALGADLDGTPVPQEASTDRGAYEFRALTVTDAKVPRPHRGVV
jgi:hypothetical protein